MMHLEAIKRRNSAAERPGHKLGAANGNPRACKHMQAIDGIGRRATMSPMESIDGAPMPEYMAEHMADASLRVEP